MVIFIIINLVGIEIVRFLCITPVTGSTKSLSLITSFGLEKCSVIPIDIFEWCYFYYCDLDRNDIGNCNFPQIVPKTFSFKFRTFHSALKEGRSKRSQQNSLNYKIHQGKEMGKFLVLTIQML